MAARSRPAHAPEPASIEVRVAGTAVSVAVHPGTDPGHLRSRIEGWLRGRADTFDDVELPHGTPFQVACWRACRGIPRGEVRTYAWLAARAGRPGAARAAGQAMRRNPMPIVIPCHRVVGAGARLGGYAGAEGGASARVKRALQDAERHGPPLPCPAPRRPRA